MELNKTSLLLIVWLSLVFSTFICGMWIGFSGEPIELGDKLFHIGLAALTLISTLWIFKTFLKTDSKEVYN
jgi:hypothetical protein